MDLDFDTFIQQINTDNDNDNGNDIFENFLDIIYNRIDNDTQEDFYIMSDDDDDEFDDLLEMIEDSEQEADYYAIAAE